MGVIARISQIQRGLGGVQLLLQGEQRATSLHYSTADNYLSAVVMPVEEMNPLNEQDAAFIALHKELRDRAAELGERRGLPEDVVHQVLDSVTEAGKFADLVVFDAERIRDTATYEQPYSFPAGIEHVVVNGNAVIRNGDFTGALPGRVLRRGG